MRTTPFRKHAARAGFTLVEIMIASAIAAIASAAMMSVFLLTSRYAGEGFTEARIVSNTSVALEKMSRELTMSYRWDAVLAADRPVITNNDQMTYTVLLDEDGNKARRRLRFVEDDNEIIQEELVGGSWENRGQGAFLEDVENFSITNFNSQGFVSYVITVRVDMGSAGGEKFYSMVGRSLPRNI